MVLHLRTTNAARLRLRFLRAAGRQQVDQVTLLGQREQEALLSERSLTIAEFCFLEHIGKSTFYKMKRLGTGPAIHYLPVAGETLPRISAQARRDWHIKLQQHQTSEAAELLAQRKQAQTSQAGKLAAASPLHVSNRKSRR